MSDYSLCEFRRIVAPKWEERVEIPVNCSWPTVKLCDATCGGFTRFAPFLIFVKRCYVVVSAVGVDWRIVQYVKNRNLAALLDLKQGTPYRGNIGCYEPDVRESVHRDTIMKVTDKMQLYRLRL